MLKPLPYTPEGYITARKILIDMGENLLSDYYRNMDGIQIIKEVNCILLEEELDNV
jgi:hypothetical protein